MLKTQTFRKVSLGLNCSDCLHFAGPAKFEKPCGEMGVDPRSRAPDCYNPDVFKLKDTENLELLQEIGQLFRKLKPKQARILSFVLSRQGGALAKQKLKFGQPVYFSLGADYLSHYFKGYVVSASDESVYVVSKLNKCKTNTSLTLERSSVFVRSEYKEIESELLEKNRIFMSPEERKRHRVLPIAELLDKKGRVPHVEQFRDDYEPPTIDTAPVEWLHVYEADSQIKRKKKKKPKDVFFSSEKPTSIVIESQRVLKNKDKSSSKKSKEKVY